MCSGEQVKVLGALGMGFARKAGTAGLERVVLESSERAGRSDSERKFKAAKCPVVGITENRCCRLGGGAIRIIGSWWWEGGGEDSREEFKAPKSAASVHIRKTGAGLEGGGPRILGTWLLWKERE